MTHATAFVDNPAAPLHISRNRYDWLGDGLYFWQDAPEHAWRWAADNAHGRSDPRPAVVDSLLAFDDLKSIDLFDMGWEVDLAHAYAVLKAGLDRAGLALPVNTSRGRRNLDRAVINLAIDMLETAAPGRRIAVVRGVFQEGVELYPGAALWTLSHVQFAVRDAAVIVDRWRVR
jgi:hypothetical protein